jgi:hypothetical protein
MLERSNGDIVKLALQDQLQFGTTCWSSELLNAVLSATDGGDVRAQWWQEQKLDAQGCIDSLTKKWIAHSERLIAGRTNVDMDSETKGFKLQVYCSWVKPAVEHRKEHFTTHVNRPDRIAELARFRLGAHSLMIEKGRHMRKPRKDRICPLCNDRQVETEMHFLQCPHLAHIRDRYPAFQIPAVCSDAQFHACMNAATDMFAWNKFADHLIELRQERTRLLT